MELLVQLSRRRHRRPLFCSFRPQSKLPFPPPLLPFKIQLALTLLLHWEKSRVILLYRQCTRP